MKINENNGQKIILPIDIFLQNINNFDLFLKQGLQKHQGCGIIPAMSCETYPHHSVKRRAYTTGSRQSNTPLNIP